MYTVATQETLNFCELAFSARHRACRGMVSAVCKLMVHRESGKCQSWWGEDADTHSSDYLHSNCSLPESKATRGPHPLAQSPRVYRTAGKTRVKPGPRARKKKYAGAVQMPALTCTRVGGAKPGRGAGGGAGAMTSGLGAAEQSSPGSGGGEGGGGGSQFYDFRAALGRGSSSGWGGPEEKLRGPVALSSASWPPPPLPHQRSDRVGEVRLPTVRSWAPERHGGHHLMAQGPWMWPSLVWSSGPRQASWPAEVMARPLPGQTCFTSYLASALGPFVLAPPAGTSGS